MRARQLLVGVVCPIAFACSSEPPGLPVTNPPSAAGASAGGTAGSNLGGGASSGNNFGGALAGSAGTSAASGSGGTSGSGGGGDNTAGMSGAAGNTAAGAGGSAGSAGAGGSAGSGGGADPADRPGWKLVWRDEFDGPAGSAPDPLKWTPRVGKATANEELEYYSDRATNLQLDGAGNLVITARKEQYMGAAYTSARIESDGKFEQKYGRFESRIKIPRGQGIWPAFWIMGNNPEVGWPQRGELDIMENRGKEPTLNIGAMHGPGYSGAQDFRAEYVIAEGVWMSFHTFSLEWEENVVRWYVDDNLYETRTPQDLKDRGGNLQWVYDHPFYVIMNVAVGGKFPGSPDGTTPFPQTLTADYVRVYARP